MDKNLLERQINKYSEKLTSLKEVYLAGISNFEESKKDFENIVIDIAETFELISKNDSNISFDRFEFLLNDEDTKADLNLKLKKLIDFLDLNINLELRKYLYGPAVFIA